MEPVPAVAFAGSTISMLKFEMGLRRALHTSGT